MNLLNVSDFGSVIENSQERRRVSVENFSNSLEGKVEKMLICRKLGLCETIK